MSEVFAQRIGIEAAELSVEICLGIFHDNEEYQNAYCRCKADKQEIVEHKLYSCCCKPDAHPQDNSKAASFAELFVEDTKQQYSEYIEHRKAIYQHYRRAICIGSVLVEMYVYRQRDH
ncbi:MAG: hypothetical protein J6A16_05990 [Oscillospiraceae bacterium]|nr:hypothetical protein [Oscillospiraceae bacterium]